MKASTREFCRAVTLTTGVSFTLITFFYLALMAFGLSGSQDETTSFTFSTYVMGKLLCVFLFSLSLGFINRIFLWNKPKAFLRILHLFLALAAFVLFLVVMFYTIFESDSLTTKGVLFNVVLFSVGYPLTLGVTALGRAIFLPKTTAQYKSILD